MTSRQWYIDTRTWNSLIMGFFEQTLPEFVAEHHHQLHFFTLVQHQLGNRFPAIFVVGCLRGPTPQKSW